MQIKEVIKDWYRGKYIPPPKNDPNSPVVFISVGHYEPPLFAKAVSFWVKHWYILFPVIAGAIVALFMHFDSKQINESLEKAEESEKIIKSKRDTTRN